MTCTMNDVQGDVLRPPHGTTPAAVKSSSFKSTERIQKMEKWAIL